MNGCIVLRTTRIAVIHAYIPNHILIESINYISLFAVSSWTLLNSEPTSEIFNVNHTIISFSSIVMWTSVTIRYTCGKLCCKSTSAFTLSLHNCKLTVWQVSCSLQEIYVNLLKLQCKLEVYRNVNFCKPLLLVLCYLQHY